MADGVSFSSPDALSWAVDIARAGPRILVTAPKAMAVTSHKIMEMARRSVRSQFGHIPNIPNSINYDLEVRGMTIVAEVGYDRNVVQGNLGHIIEYGSAAYNAPNAPQRNVGKAADANLEDFVDGMRKAATDAFHS